jgi:hypothetical protein
MESFFVIALFQGDEIVILFEENNLQIIRNEPIKYLINLHVKICT